MNFINSKYLLILSVLLICVAGCGMTHRDSDEHRNDNRDIFSDTLLSFISTCPGEIGVAVITGKGDTIVANNEDTYPLMSVFKLHQAIAICHQLELSGISRDTIITMTRKSLDAETWSPMLKEHTESVIKLPLSRLLEYTLKWSDNNASNEMFRQLMPVKDCDSFIATLIPRDGFRLKYTESEMKADHSKAYDNHTSPLSAASLIYRLFTDSVIGRDNQYFLQQTLKDCDTGMDRIVAPLQDIDDVEIAHKTGSGYINDKGELMAHNDVAFIRLHDGFGYALAVFVKDFRGNEKEASVHIAYLGFSL